MKNKFLDSDLFPLYKPEPPFMPIKNGFGYKGVILQSRTSGKIQCHICGKLFKNVARHVYHKHNVSQLEYRKFADINNGTPLVCESTSAKIRQVYLDLPASEKQAKIKLLQENSKKVHASNNWKGIKRKGPVSTQFKNQFGTCDLQAKHCFWQEYRTLGHIPNNKEMSGKLKNLVYTRFSSYEEALKTWGVSNEEIQQYKHNGKQKAVEVRKAHNFYPKYDKDTVTREIKNFISKKHRLPTWNEAEREGLPSREVFKRLFGTNRKIELESIFQVHSM